MPKKKRVINPKDNHISFQCSNFGVVVRKLNVMGIEYVTAAVEDGGIKVDQLFFHDPDGYMVEICNCNNLPVLPLSSCQLNLPTRVRRFEEEKINLGSYGKKNLKCSTEVEDQMMERLVKDIMDISF